MRLPDGRRSGHGEPGHVANGAICQNRGSISPARGTGLRHPGLKEIIIQHCHPTLPANDQPKNVGYIADS
jgi:hypothetical protein